MMSNDNIRIQLEDTISIDNDQLTFDLGDDVTYDVASVTGSSSGTTYGNGRFDPTWYGTNDTGSEYTVNIGTGPIVTESCFKTDVEEMSKDYPGLDKAWRNFKLFYDICKSDFDKKKETDA
tara:strand:- start:561 stop:923 length:363 start_codon:yes stop_codon:yes gene_type:complete